MKFLVSETKSAESRERGGMPNLNAMMFTRGNGSRLKEDRERGGMPNLNETRFTGKTLAGGLSGWEWEHGGMPISTRLKRLVKGTGSECLRNTVVCSNAADDVPRKA